MKPQHLPDLPTYQIHVLANISSKIAAHVNAREFELGPRDWRIIGILEAFNTMSLLSLAKEVGVDKSQASRMVATLIDKGWVQSVVSEQDARSIDLSLTESGLALFRKVLPHAIARNQELLNVLSADEQRQLFNALQKLTLHAKEIWDHERQLKI